MKMTNSVVVAAVFFLGFPAFAGTPCAQWAASQSLQIIRWRDQGAAAHQIREFIGPSGFLPTSPVEQDFRDFFSIYPTSPLTGEGQDAIRGFFRDASPEIQAALLNTIGLPGPSILNLFESRTTDPTSGRSYSERWLVVAEPGRCITGFYLYSD